MRAATQGRPHATWGGHAGPRLSGGHAAATQGRVYRAATQGRVYRAATQGRVYRAATQGRPYACGAFPEMEIPLIPGRFGPEPVPGFS